MSQDIQKISDEIFEKFDADKSGSIDAGELHAMLKDLCEFAKVDIPSEDDAKKALTELDTNADGKLSKSEFAVLVKLLLEAANQ
mmetsp:Transcript_99232/g.137885  ORF Transcript_99232/g.137885 Transcript_99232/m.137885 type:complete len:84 (+) Transcript_99232:99-350(+)